MAPARGRESQMSEGVLRIASMKGRCSAEEWQARVDLAACYRLVDLYGMSDMMANHISMRVPGEEAFLIKPYGMMYDEITASCLIKVDLAGNILSKPDFGALNYRINKAGYVIHSAVHEALPLAHSQAPPRSSGRFATASFRIAACTRPTFGRQARPLPQVVVHLAQVTANLDVYSVLASPEVTLPTLANSPHGSPPRYHSGLSCTHTRTQVVSGSWLWTLRADRRRSATGVREWLSVATGWQLPRDTFFAASVRWAS
jgi:hypothetical protein